MTLPNPHDGPQHTPQAPPPPRYRNMAEAVAAAPAWPMLTRTQERLLKVVWARSLMYGRCFTGQAKLGEAIGVSDRQVRNLVEQLTGPGWRWLRRERQRGEVDLLRVVLPDQGPRHLPMYGNSKPRKSASPTPRKSASGDPGNAFPPNNTNTNTTKLGGSPNPGERSPLFDAKDLRAEQFRLGCTSLCETVLRLFQKGDVERARTPVRRFPRKLLDVQASTLGSLPCVRLIFPTAGGGVFTVDFCEDDLLGLEFYP